MRCTHALCLGGENIVVAVYSSKFPYYRAVGCIKMGKHSPQMKIAQRKCQKATHKLKFTPNAKPATTYVGSVPSSPLGSPNEMAENTDDEELDALGVDLDVVEMTCSQFTYSAL